MNQEKLTKCPSCDSDFMGIYCHNCGEKRLSEADFSLMQLLKQFFSAITDVNSKYLTTLRLLILKPGQLSKDHITGIRKSRLNPLQLFVFINLIYFLIVSFSHINTFSTPLGVHVNANNFIHQSMAKSLVDEKITSEKISYSEYEKDFNQKIELRSKALVFLMIPLIFVLMMVLNSKHSRKPYLSLVSSIHFMAWLMVLLVLVNSALIVMSWLLNGFSLSNIASVLLSDLWTSIMLAIFIAYYYFSYSTRWNENSNLISRTIKSLLFLAGVYLCVLIYRMLLFFISFYF